VIRSRCCWKLQPGGIVRVWAVVLTACVAAVMIGGLWNGVDGAAAATPVGADPLVTTALLYPSDNPISAYSYAGFESGAISGGIAVAGAPGATVGMNQAQGEVYVFSEPARGWSSESETAKLVASDGQANDYFGSAVAISGNTIVVLRGGSAPAIYVFTKPAGGWVGTVHESAELTVANPKDDALGPVAMSGNTIVVAANSYCNCSPVPSATAELFTEPTGGWTGKMTETATLTVPGVPPTIRCFYSVAIEGPTIAATCAGHGYVFTEPSSGWTGTVTPSATLRTPATMFTDSIALFGSHIVASPTSNFAGDPIIFDRPSNGWSGTINRTAQLKVAPDQSDGIDEPVVASGSEIATLVVPENDQSCGILPTCPATLYGFSEPYEGWRGTIAGPSAPVTVTGTLLGISGRTVMTGGEPGLDLYTITPGAPAIRNGSLSAVGSGKPKLDFTLTAGEGAAPIESLMLRLPLGLRCAQQPIGRGRGIKTSAPTRSRTCTGRAFSIALRRASDNLTMTIRAPGLVAEPSLIHRIQQIGVYNRHHASKHTLALTIRITAIDTTHHTTPLVLRIRIP
jgi:FG-GAP repeat